ncbi:hypothetical protein TWF730_009622 [Orbilia blumenaviensis]|uniref:SYO1-like TPR repeats domain-containing protein n=1 Tax=Orbilia blumenaviensis TaxID=1796055 RepID=A0AAV9UVJ8_9PEZI
MADNTSKKRWKQPEPRTCRKSSATTVFSWTNPKSNISVNSAEAEILRDQKVLPIIAGIQAGSPAERTQHLVAACSIVEDPICRKLLLKQHIIQTILDKVLADASEEVTTAGWGLLNKIVLYEGYDIALHLYRKGIFEKIDVAVQTIYTGMTSLAADSKALSPAAQSLLWDYTFSVVSLLTKLSETTKEALKRVTSQEVITLAASLLGRKINGRSSITIPGHVQTATVTLLDRMTDQNPLAYELVTSEPGLVHCLMILHTMRAEENPVGLAPTCSTLHNLVYQSLISKDSWVEDIMFADARLIAPLSIIVRTVLAKQSPTQEEQQALFLSLETLSAISNCTVETFGHNAPEGVNGIDGGDQDDDEGDQEDGDDFHMDGVERGLIMGKANSSSDEEEEGADIDDDNDDEPSDDEPSDEELPDELGADMAMVTGDEGTVARASKKKPFMSPELELLYTSTIPIVLPLAIATPSSETENNLRLAGISLLCAIAGAFSTLSSKSHKSKLTIPQVLMDSYYPSTHRIWDNLITPILISNSADIKLAEKITELAIHITGFSPSVSVSNNQHKSFLALYNATDSIPLKVLCIKVLLNLARCQGTERIEVNKELGTFFMTTVNKLPFLGDPEPADLPAPEVIIECLNAVYDVYDDMDNDYDEEVFVKLGFLKYLNSFVGRLRAMAKKIDRRKHLELRESADDALINLSAFIKYKSKEREEM